jgi:hypothetical protein
MGLADITSDFIDDPFKFLIRFVMLLVPSSLFVWLFTFIEFVVYLVIIAFFIGTVLRVLGIKK